MDLNHPIHEFPEVNHVSRRSVLAIDLNEFPSSSLPEPPNPFHTNTRVSEPPTAHPDRPLVCSSCRKPESSGLIIVCDGCDHGFHMACSGVPENRGLSMLDDWLCVDCVRNGVQSQGWRLGPASSSSFSSSSSSSFCFNRLRRGARLLDINALPPSDGEGEANEDCRVSRKYYPLDEPSTCKPHGFLSTHMDSSGNGFGVHSTDESTEDVTILSENIIHHSQENGARFTEACFPPRKHVFRSNNNRNHSVRFSSQNLNETLMKTLRDYISQRNGVLEDRWHVETRQSKKNLELHVIYVSPDGLKFESACEVAGYLGLPKYPSAKVQSLPTLKKLLCFTRRKKDTAVKFPISNGFPENGEAPGASVSSNTSSGSQSMEFFSPHLGNHGKITKLKDSPNCAVANLHPFNNGLPIQFNDFCIISLGNIDSRPSYHDANHIWPVGYKSSWHDKVTRSLFIFEVLDGGDSGPIFRVSRYSCSTSSILKGLTVIVQGGDHNKQPIHDVVSSSHGANDGEIDVNMIFSDIHPPAEVDILSCLGSGASRMSDNHITSSFRVGIFSEERPQGPFQEYLDVGEGIGEFSFEGCSPSLVWKMVSQNIVNACFGLFLRTENLRLFCEHSKNEAERSGFDLNPLSKFCSSVCVSMIPSVISSTDVENFKILVKWLEEDRSGLDMEFVQEFIEQVPGADGCLQYKYVNKRMSFTTSITVGNGKLYKMDGEQHDQEKCIEGYKETLSEIPEKSSVDKGNLQRPPPPQGRTLSEKLPVGLLGDVVQISELLGRFHEVLGLTELLSLEELEKELINPCFTPPLFSPNFKKESNVSLGVKVGETNGHGGLFPFFNESSKMVIDIEEGSMYEAIQSKLVPDRLHSCTGVMLTEVHKALLNVLVSEVLSKVATFVDPNLDTGDTRTRRSRKKDVDNHATSKRTKLHTLPINELTWPEIARRYILAFVAGDGNNDFAENASRESGKLFRCLQGDGGVLCGALTGVAGMEADALLLAEAIKQVFGSLNNRNIPIADGQVHYESPAHGKEDFCADENIPEWAEVLEPVKKLPTNVGTRIRKCVYDALNRNPPDWARIILQHSISKGVYKGNASGPTKKAVMSVLEQVTGVSSKQKPDRQRKKKKTVDASEVIMKKCRVVLRMAVSADDAKVFCNFLGNRLPNSSDNDDGGVLGCPGMTSRPIDFRTIDLRLALGAYGGSHEAFLEDVRELWDVLCTAYGDQPELFELARNLSQNFESLYNKDVLTFVKKIDGIILEGSSVEAKELEFLFHMDEMPKAPWDDGVCKICGIDKDDDNVLLCDKCDAEYHTYCLNPPLTRIPEGNWYCPSCITATFVVENPTTDPTIIDQCEEKRYQGSSANTNLDALTNFACIMGEKEYWEFSVSERIFLLKFLSDELLSSVVVRQHLEQCSEMSSELLQKLRAIYNECKSLKFKEELLSIRASKADSNFTTTGETKNEKVHMGLLLNYDSKDPNTITDIISDNHPDTLDSLKDSNGDMVTDGRIACVYSRVNSIITDKTPVSNEHFLSQDPDPAERGMNNDPTHMYKRMEIERYDHTPPVANIQKTGVPSESKSPNIFENVVSTSEEIIRLEIGAVKNDMSILEDSIVDMESRLLKLSVRREFLGSDSSGRLYWILESPVKLPLVVVEGTVVLEKVESTSKRMVQLNRDSTSSFISYQSDSEIQELVEWLKDDDMKEKELKDAIFHWQKMKIQNSKHSRLLNYTEPLASGDITNDFPFSSLVIRATNVLESKCSSFSESEVFGGSNKSGNMAKLNKDEKIFRCECLEPIFSSRFHCFICHKTFENDPELQKHNDGKCSLMTSNIDKSKGNTNLMSEQKKSVVSMKDGSKINEVSRSDCSNMTSVLIAFRNEEPACPFNIEEICSNFITKDSNRDLVREIGLISSGGIPLFIPAPSSHNSFSKILTLPEEDDIFIFDREEADENRGNANSCHVDDLPCTSMGSDDAARIFKRERVIFGPKEGNEVGHYCLIPHSSSRRLTGHAYNILRCLKSNLLDMDAALPIEALRPSKVRIERRWAWRAFTKASKSIFEMVLATIAMEDMLKSEHLMKWWWHWSSYSAAAKTSTLSSLALRISSLDSAIIYDKVSPSTAAPPPPILDSVDRPRPGRRPGKRKRDAES